MSARRTPSCQLCGRRDAPHLIGGVLCRDCAPPPACARQLLTQARFYLAELEGPPPIDDARLDRRAAAFAVWLGVFVDERVRRCASPRTPPPARAARRPDGAPDQDLARAVLDRAGLWLREVDGSAGMTDSARLNRALAGFAARLAAFVDGRIRRCPAPEHAGSGTGADAEGADAAGA